jgi:hypothetical protein
VVETADRRRRKIPTRAGGRRLVAGAAALGLGLLAGAAGAAPPPAARAPSAVIPVQNSRSGTQETRHGAARKPEKAAPGGAATPQTPKGAIGELQPVLHAERAGITTCMDTIVGEAAAAVDSRHTAISSWSRAAPNKNIFLSIVGLRYANKAAPNGAAVLFAAPLGPGRCQGGTVQVYPVAQSCSALQARLIKHDHTIAVLRALPVVESKAGIRYVLIPTVGDGCTLVAIGLRQ